MSNYPKMVTDRNEEIPNWARIVQVIINLYRFEQGLFKQEMLFRRLNDMSKEEIGKVLQILQKIRFIKLCYVGDDWYIEVIPIY